MPADKKDDKKGATGAKVCKHCGKPTFADASGKLRHERRGLAAITDPKAAKPGADGKPAATEQEPELPPQREHGLMRRIGGKKEE